MKILGIVFIYNPDEDRLVSNIERYIMSIHKLVVFNNSPNVENEYYKTIFDRCPFSERIELIGGEGNKGLAYPINIAIKKAVYENYDALLTMDQDSIWNNFNEYISSVEKQYDYHEKIFRPNIHKTKCNSIFCETSDVLFNSGTLYGVEALRKIGIMNEVMFVEGIDIEYGIRAKLLGVPILTYRDGDMEHNREEIDNYHKRIFGKNIPRCKYNAQRLYGITFSNVLMAREFSGSIRKKIICGFIKGFGLKTTIIPILLFENGKTKRLMYYFKGIWDALFVEVIKFK